MRGCDIYGAWSVHVSPQCRLDKKEDKSSYPHGHLLEPFFRIIEFNYCKQDISYYFGEKKRKKKKERSEPSRHFTIFNAFTHI